MSGYTVPDDWHRPSDTPFSPRPGETLLQPHEGITGVDRRDSLLLSREPEARGHRDALISMAYHLKTACLVGDPAPVVTRMWQRIDDPQPGDLVVEVSAMWSVDPDTRCKGFGFVITRRREWASTDAEWDAAKCEAAEGEWGHEMGDDERLVEPDAWYIQYAPHAGDVCRWENCSFIVLPVGIDFRSPVGMPSPDRPTMITRDDLVSGLGDSGFTFRAAAEGRS